VDNSLERLAYEASLRSLDKQDEVLNELRARTGLLLAASSLAASFLGRPALDADPIVIGVLALGAFALSIIASVYVLAPKTNLVFSLAGSALYERLFEFRNEMPEVYRRLAYDLDRFWDSNDRIMVRLFRAFWVAAAGLLGEVVLLLTSISGTLL
jgi:hypothetical protein